MSLRGNTTATYFIFSTIVILSFFGNLMVLGVMLMKRGAFKKAYNIFIFSLACTDVITAIFLIFSRYLYLPDMPANKISATLFCSTIWNACILFGLGYVSIYTCLVLAIERWLAIVKPNIYRKTRPSQAVIIVGFVWFWGLLIQATTLFRAKPDFEKGTCKWTKLNIGEGPFPYIDITLQCVLPFTTMLLLYLHMLYKVKKMPNLLQGRGAAISKRITILALAASCALVIGWLPSRVSFMLSKLNLNDPNGLLHFWLVAFSFANSFVNPFLYGVYSSEFRRDYKALLSKLVCIKGMSISPSLDASTNKRKGSIRFSLSNADTFTIALDTDV
ncbi:somatostatin receptor type 1-like [Xenia sp. Carnegie-2017]|uniref:somatostatin receptor type 1-like n=1 Tax=Xenia sp. Carnegie-2017 TaxID=2897299 RepID=UPI001F04F78B|nr:somatostatin receptor type 1-like [Xenia sp. Carnegie-2017]